MSNTYRKIRKLFRDPALFLADSRVMRQHFQVTANRVVRGGTSREHEAYLGNPFALFPKGIDFVLYFSAKKALAYQVEQWLPTLRVLAKSHTVVILTREDAVYRHFVKTTEFPIMYCKSLRDLMAFYERIQVGAVIYVNNSVKNFQSLIHQDSLHVHINHGESEKSSMHSNQAKAYDYVFVVADAGQERYERNLLRAETVSFVHVGRPQLDGIVPIAPRSDGHRRVVLYAPTWSAYHDSMNYSSIAAYGERIAEAFVDHPDFHFIYRPHPSVGISNEDEAKAHAAILARVDATPHAELLMEGDINSIFPAVDIGIFDNSSVLIDYLRVDKPFMLTRILPAGTKLPRVAAAGHVLTHADYDDLRGLCLRLLTEDPEGDRRRAEKHYYLGEYGEAEATAKFVSALESILTERHRLVQQRGAHRPPGGPK